MLAQPDTPPHSYIAYGLGVRSAVPLPELLPANGATDVVIRLGKVKRPAEQLSSGGTGFHVEGDELCLWYDNVGTFLLQAGSAIVVDPMSGINPDLLRLALLGPALGVLLHQRGRLVLHASAVEIAGGAVAFLGGSGWGKSTTAAVLSDRGHRLLTDDLLALDLDVEQSQSLPTTRRGWVVDRFGEPPVVQPSFPRLKLWPKAARVLGNDLDKLPRLHDAVEKRDLRVAEQFSSDPVPLRCIYVLDSGRRRHIEALGPQESLIELVRHSYCAALLPYTGAARHFEQCARLVTSIPIFRLQRPRSLRGLAGLASLIEGAASQTV